MRTMKIMKIMGQGTKPSTILDKNLTMEIFFKLNLTLKWLLRKIAKSDKLQDV